jgi:hypothetical protein
MIDLLVAAVPSGPNWTPPPTTPIKKNSHSDYTVISYVLEVVSHYRELGVDSWSNGLGARESPANNDISIRGHCWDPLPSNDQ